MDGNIHYCGIRHHGPGSARQVLHTLETLQPSSVLIEGPIDQSDLIPLMAHEEMRPPVALLTYPKENPEEARFWPFVDYSPEFQAIRWALAHQVPVRFIDLPTYWEPAEPLVEEEAPLPMTDPIGLLAHAAGYDDGESWWNNLIEENTSEQGIFDAITEAMTALREGEPPLSQREAAREAHMRLEIKKESKSCEGNIAVICGAFHVPALLAKHTLKDDRAKVKAKGKKKMLATWAPWTFPRMATHSGYGAGVTAPNWYQHLWSTPRDPHTLWLVHVARTLREKGHFIPSASIIEAERLSVTLASIRQKPQPGFEELQQACVACMCHGESALWHTIEPQILIGDQVGSIPDDVPLAPLLEDLKRQQKSTRLKPEALDRELAIDLRSESGLQRSTLLHRLDILGVSWGRLIDKGRSRGTFRERWILAWQPEFAVALVENLVYGATIAQAATTKLQGVFKESISLPDLATGVMQALTAQLPEAASFGIECLHTRAAQVSDCRMILETLPPIADILRYGEARTTDTSQMESLFHQLVTQCALSLHYGVQNLDRDASLEMSKALLTADNAIRLLLTTDSDPLDLWIRHLLELLENHSASRLIVGTAARLLYECEDLSASQAVLLIERQLTPGTPTSDAADFFEGFFEGCGTRLIHDHALRDAVDRWLYSLDDETFTNQLPLMRRVFASLDSTERTHLLETLSLPAGQAHKEALTPHADADHLLNSHAQMIHTLFQQPFAPAPDEN